ncbi:Deoxyhypusine synthase [Fusarium oxysporum f. sp. albedinis]|nr:Deoxyhypusine synthase [Fusarium oxysporum f. sp. albedinis]
MQDNTDPVCRQRAEIATTMSALFGGFSALAPNWRHFQQLCTKVTRTYITQIWRRGHCSTCYCNYQHVYNMCLKDH